MKARLFLLNAFVYTVVQIGLLLTTTKPARAIPKAVIVPALCAGSAGIGCVLIVSTVVGGVIYQVWQVQNGSYISTITAIDAVALGNAHWGNNPNFCRNMAKRNNWRLKEIIPATGGGYWCIFQGRQTDFTDNN